MDYLIEVGTEELPYKFILSAKKQLESAFQKLFKENQISFDNILFHATPRRLCVVVKNIALKQEDIEKIIKGPKSSIFYDESGNPTNAALGFMKKNNITLDDVFVENDYIQAKVNIKGRLTSELITENIEKIFLSLEGNHFMRWADLPYKFQRPVRWVVSLLDDKELSVSIAGVKSSQYSRGHRFKSESCFIPSIDEYENVLYKNNVIVDETKRKQTIVDETTKLAKTIDAQVVFDEELLEEVCELCEWVKPVLCSFDEKYLSIPEKVIVTVMASHQRYFPLYKNGKLLNKFITIANYIGDDVSNIIEGNVRVIKARLEDAIFFYEDDIKTKLEDKLQDLKGMTFQKNCGNMFDKTMRLIELSKFLTVKLKLDDKTDDITRTAKLAKCDLATKLVFEFTELQGFIGQSYAQISGEKENVSLGICEHYFPLNAKSETPTQIEGQVVSIADKIDNIVSIFAQGKKPTGSADPLGVRRQVLGIIRTILDNNLNIDLVALIDKTIDISPCQIADKTQLKNQIIEFIEQRLKIYLNDNYRYDVLDCVLSNENSLININNSILKLDVVEKLTKDNDFNIFCENANRIIRILKDIKNDNVDTTLFTSECEEELYNKLNSFIETQDYNKTSAFLKELTPHVVKFFENVLVMDKDENIKNNRIALLTKAKNIYSILGDFSKIVN